MAENSAIEWTDHTFNPWIGCTKVSDGCKHCYAETLMDHRYGKVQWGPQGERKRTSDANWRKPI
jgi:protein gp37